MDRRQFLRSASAALIASPALMACASEAANRRTSLTTSPLASRDPTGSQTWLGSDWWANRLQDWARDKHEIICRATSSDLEGRTAHCLTRSIEPGAQRAQLRVRVRNSGEREGGMAGLLIGAGDNGLDYRSAALIQRFSGESGGIIAVVTADGLPELRAFDDPQDSLDYALFGDRSRNPSAIAPNATIELIVDIEPLAPGRCNLRACSIDVASGNEIGCAVAPDVAVDRLVGNIALFASPGVGDQPARWALSEFGTGGDIAVHPERSLGPVMACLHSLNRNVMKMTIQLMPVASSELSEIALQFRAGGGGARTVTSRVGAGFAAQFRLDDWDPEHDHPYVVLDPRNPDKPLFEGTVRADPGSSRPLNVALHSCLLPSSRSLDEANYAPRIPQETEYGRYTSDNLVFPHTEMVNRCESKDPDLYVFAGDQYYETFPTRRGHDGPDALLDTLYRWYLFLWTFRDALRDKPVIVLADDHDILQGNLWGNEGENSEMPREEDGGFKRDKGLVRTIYRLQTGHNPDPWDEEPIAYDIPVSFGRFVYGNTSFAFVEDRKFKDPPDTETDPLETRGDLLGERQEAFLKEWATVDPGMPKVCLTASIWGSPQTAGNLTPLLDYDSNGYPPDGRNRAVQLLKDAGAIALAGDQHLAMLAIQGIHAPGDGPLFFAGPAGSAFWQRWFEGLGQLANQRSGDPNTGDFIDCFGNPMRVLAVANPRIGYDEFMASKDYWGNFVADHRLKSEGFGIVRVDHQNSRYIFECWPRSETDLAGGQFDGWPYIHPIDREL